MKKTAQNGSPGAYFSGFWGYSPPAKPAGPSLAARISRLLAGGRSIVGRYDLAKELWPSGWTSEQMNQLNGAVRDMIALRDLVETPREVPGAHEHAAAIEYVYSLPEACPPTQRC
jgi:hypothetical protein